MLGEKFGIYECSSVVITLIGVTLVSKPGFLPFFDTNQLQSATDLQLSKTLNHTESLLNQFSNFTNSSLTSMISDNSTDYIAKAENYHVIGMVLAFIGAITFALSNIYVSILMIFLLQIKSFKV